MANTRRPPSATEMVHPAVRQHFKLGEGSSPAFTEAAAPGAVPPHVAFGYDEAMQREKDLRTAEFMARMQAGEMAYDQGGGPGATRATPITARAQTVLDRDHARRERIAAVPDYQRKGQAGLRGYASNPLEEAGRHRMVNQFWEAPLGGHVRAAAEGLGLEADHARMAEQGLAGLTAVGIGVPAFMAAVHQLSTPPDQNAIPL
jgi:hypothetical protein